MTIPKTVYKAHGMGNDFVIYLDDANKYIPNVDEIKYLCDRHFGVGGDGLIRLDISFETLKNADAFMDYYNADGSTAQMCGNGARVCGAFYKQMINKNGRDGLGEINLNTRSGVKNIKFLDGDLYQINMGSYKIDGNFVNMGNPHKVELIRKYEDFQKIGIGKENYIPDDMNYEFIYLNPEINNPLNTIEMRVWERGVGETLSCGTGICASAIYASKVLSGDNSEKSKWNVKVKGGLAYVEVFENEVILTAPAKIVAEIKLLESI